MFSSSTADPLFSPDQPAILGFDPGRQKCGLAVLGLDRRLYYHEVVAAESVVDKIQALREQFPISLMVMGDQTMAQSWKQRLTDELFDPLRIVLVDERYSSLEARDRYWKMYPPGGLFRLIPQGMRSLPRPVDDIVAILLIERYLERLVS